MRAWLGHLLDSPQFMPVVAGIVGACFLVGAVALWIVWRSEE
jgi:hypothetical protein